MPGSLDLTAFENILKIHYAPMRVENLVYKKEPFLGMLRKYDQFGGKSLPIPIQYSHIKGRSAAFSAAQGNVGPSSFGEFDLKRVRDYAIAHLDGETIAASRGDKNAFLQAVVTEVNSAFRAITRSMSSALFRSGTGSIAVVAAGGISEGGGNTTIQLASPEEVTNFEVGVELVASETDGGALRGGGASYRVLSVNRDSGIVVVVGTAITTSSWAVGDFLYMEGDAAAAGANRKLSGLTAWLPATAPGSTAFFGQDRSVDPTRLGGLRYNASAETIEEGLISSAARLGREGGSPDAVFVAHKRWAELAKELGSRVQHDIVASSNGKLGYKSIVLAAPTGDMNIVADHNCQEDAAYMLQMDTWKLYSLGKAPRILNEDGVGTMLRRSDADGYELRVGYYAQLGCTAPGWNARITLPS